MENVRTPGCNAVLPRCTSLRLAGDKRNQGTEKCVVCPLATDPRPALPQTLGLDPLHLMPSDTKARETVHRCKFQMQVISHIYTWLIRALFLVLPGTTAGRPRPSSASPPPLREAFPFSWLSSTSCNTSYENCGNSRHMARNSGSAS